MKPAYTEVATDNGIERVPSFYDSQDERQLDDGRGWDLLDNLTEEMQRREE